MNALSSFRLKGLIEELRRFKGLTRKSSLWEILKVFSETSYDDAGFFEINGFKVVVSCDGIVEDLVRDNPWLAGYYCVLVNVNDVVAKGARPIGFVNVISSSSSAVRRAIAEGIAEGLRKYELKLLKGHTHPDTSYDSVDGAAVGVAKNVLPSTAAEPGDALVFAVDLIGELRSKGWVKAFDSITVKQSHEILRQLNSMAELAERKLAHAARDVSGPGLVGTIAMLCESSRVGALIDLKDVPKPKGVSLNDWLIAYPSLGFIISTDKPEDCLSLLKGHGLEAAVIGEVTAKREIWLSYEGQLELFLDLRRESIFGVNRF